LENDGRRKLRAWRKKKIRGVTNNTLWRWRKKKLRGRRKIKPRDGETTNCSLLLSPLHFVLFPCFSHFCHSNQPLFLSCTQASNVELCKKNKKSLPCQIAREVVKNRLLIYHFPFNIRYKVIDDM